MINTMARVPDKYLVSDLCSKIFLDAASKCNTEFWRHGPTEYKDVGLIEHFWFLKHRHGLTEYRDLPKISVTDSQPLAEIIADNPIDGPPVTPSFSTTWTTRWRSTTPPNKKDFTLEDMVNMCTVHCRE